MLSKEKTQNKRGITKVLFLIFIIIAMILLVRLAWAKYRSSLSGSAKQDVAQWSFNYKILNTTQTKEVENFAVTRTDNNNEVNKSTIAPGTSGEFILEIDATRNRNITNV